jgi:hypothetical protein
MIPLHTVIKSVNHSLWGAFGHFGFCFCQRTIVYKLSFVFEIDDIFLLLNAMKKTPFWDQGLKKKAKGKRNANGTA